MGELDIPLDEAGLRNDGVRLDDALAKKGELVSEFETLLRANITREIPPLRLEIRMAPVILREFVIPTRQGGLPLRVCERGGCQKDEQKISFYPQEEFLRVPEA